MNTNSGPNQPPLGHAAAAFGLAAAIAILFNTGVLVANGRQVGISPSWPSYERPFRSSIHQNALSQNLSRKLGVSR